MFAKPQTKLKGLYILDKKKQRLVFYDAEYRRYHTHSLVVVYYNDFTNTGDFDSWFEDSVLTRAALEKIHEFWIKIIESITEA